MLFRSPTARVVCAEADDLVEMLEALAAEASRVTRAEWRAARVGRKAVLTSAADKVAVVVDVRVYRPDEPAALPVQGFERDAGGKRRWCSFERKFFGRVLISALTGERSCACAVM